jgi:hypothetical protein
MLVLRTKLQSKLWNFIAYSAPSVKLEMPIAQTVKKCYLLVEIYSLSDENLPLSLLIYILVNLDQTNFLEYLICTNFTFLYEHISHHSKCTCMLHHHFRLRGCSSESWCVGYISSSFDVFGGGGCRRWSMACCSKICRAHLCFSVLRGLCAKVPEQLVFWSVRVFSVFVS